MLHKVLAASAALLFSATAALAAPLEVYGRLPTIEDAAISPDGRRFAVITTEGEERRVLVREIATGKTNILAAGAAKVRSLTWASPQHLLITTTTTAIITNVIAPRSEYATVIAYDVDRNKQMGLLRDADNGLNVALGAPAPRVVNGKPVVFLQGVRFDSGGKGRVALYRIDLSNGASKVEHAGYPNTEEWLVGPDGEPLAESEFDPKTGRWLLKLKQEAGWRVVKSVTDLMGGPELMGLGRDGRSVLIAEDMDDEVVLREFAADTEQWSDPVPLRAGQSVIFDPKGFHMIGARTLVGDEYRYDFISEADQKVWRSVSAAYKGEHVQLLSWSDNRERMLLRVDSPTEGAGIAYVDLKTKRADWVGPVYRDLTKADIAEVRPLRFKAADGLELTGYLTLPRGRDAKKLPLVVLAHGGPASRDEPQFDWWSQGLASRGYAVLRVNFRGSSGFGREFMEAGYGQWGRKMQTDLSDGVRHLASQGLIDPGRTCIVGASYGGYAALAGVTMDRGVYRCAASVAGVSDLRRMVAWSKTHRGVTAQRYWVRFMGAEDPRDPVLRELSPAEKAAGVKTPVLLIHGRDDTVVPLEQTKIMERALKDAGNPAEVVVMPGEDHWLSRGDTRLQMLTTVVNFLEKNNPPS